MPMKIEQKNKIDETDDLCFLLWLWSVKHQKGSQMIYSNEGIK